MGLKALKQYGKDNIAFFCDNAKEKYGTSIHGIKVISFEQLMKIHEEYEILVTPINNFEIIAQLDQNGINNYKVYIASDSSILHNGEKEEKKYEKENKILDEFSLKTDALDMLTDINEFQKLAKELEYLVKQEDMIRFHRGYNFEGFFYGNVQTLLNYAGLDNSNIKYAPMVSHGGMPLYSVGTQYRYAVIFQGTYLKKLVHQHFPYIPVFTVGPYIHYASGIYSNEKIKNIKEHNGKTLLVYMPHSIEDVKREFCKQKFIDDVLLKYKNSFSTIYLCVYWADVNEPVCEYAIEKGMKVVCIGFRFDVKFNYRQKSLLEIADAVVFGDIGSFVYNAIYLKKPVGRVEITNNTTICEKQYSSDNERRIQFINDYKLFSDKFYDIFSEKLDMNDKMFEWANPFSGFDKLKSAEEIKEIISISKDIIEECDDKLDKYEAAVYNLLLKYKKADERKYNVLKEAVDV